MEALYQDCLALLIYRDVLSDKVGQAFLSLLTSDAENAVFAYSAWFSALAEVQQGWQEYLLHRILTAENPFTRQASPLPVPVMQGIEHDLRILQRLYACTSAQICQWASDRAQKPLVPWADHLAERSETPRQQEMLRLRSVLADISARPHLETASDWALAIPELAAFYRKFGTGVFAEYSAFRWQNGQFVPIAHPDPIEVDTLVGYETQRDTLLKNTEFLLAGLPALHVLLYGSRGSGKSSLVKSLLQKFSDRNLRLVEVGKAELKDLSAIVEQLRNLPQKFVIFVDDLSFEEDDDAFKALKVVLEGNLTARPQNLVVYATSNRRHLIREFYGDRPRPKDADEVHQWDTMQEKLSFSDRFGLTLTFEPADQPTYLKIVHHLAEQAEISLSSEDLEFRALQWATRHNGRSGRTARQFIDFLRADLILQTN